MSRKLSFGDEEQRDKTADLKPKKPKQRGKADTPKQVDTDTPDSSPEPSEGIPTGADNAADIPIKTSSNGKLNFSSQERKIGNLEQKSYKYAKKLNKARAKLPTKKRPQKKRVFNEEKQKPKSKLDFKKDTVPINEAKWNVRKKNPFPEKRQVRSKQRALISSTPRCMRWRMKMSAHRPPIVRSLLVKVLTVAAKSLPILYIVLSATAPTARLQNLRSSR